jgi:hypothetical protein
MTLIMTQPSIRRWYDQVPEMSIAVESMRDMPPSMQQAIAKHILEQVELLRQYARFHRLPLSLGVPKVFLLYQRQNRRRWHDKDPAIRQAFFTLPTFPMTFIEEFSDRIQKLDALLTVPPERLRGERLQQLQTSLDALFNNRYDLFTERQRSIHINPPVTGADLIQSFEFKL